jgi:hypothetical protein
MRFFLRIARKLFGMQSPGEHPAERAARLVGFAVPAGYNPRPQWWQRGRRGHTPKPHGRKPNPYAPRPTAAEAPGAD